MVTIGVMILPNVCPAGFTTGSWSVSKAGKGRIPGPLFHPLLDEPSRLLVPQRIRNALEERLLPDMLVQIDFLQMMAVVSMNKANHFRDMRIRAVVEDHDTAFGKQFIDKKHVQKHVLKQVRSINVNEAELTLFLDQPRKRVTRQIFPQRQMLVQPFRFDQLDGD